MDKDNFLLFLKKTKRSNQTIRNYLEAIKEFDDFLEKQVMGTEPASAKPEDLRAFADWKQNDRRVRIHFMAITVYYDF
jgi:hypothetical protein